MTLRFYIWPTRLNAKGGRALHRRLIAEGYRIDRVVNHGNAIGATSSNQKATWPTVLAHRLRLLEPNSERIDLADSDAAIPAAVQRVIERERDVPMGGVQEPAARPA